LYHSPLSSLLSVVHLPTLGFSVLSLIYPWRSERSPTVIYVQHMTLP
jgi:hypothetical protein